MCKFDIGQRVVAIQNHAEANIKKGDEFTIIGINKFCKHWVVDVGIRDRKGQPYCVKCDVRQNNFTDVWFIVEDTFAPINNELSSFTTDKLLEEMDQFAIEPIEFE